jgi:flagellar hook-associated protein 3 FlgL
MCRRGCRPGERDTALGIEPMRVTNQMVRRELLAHLQSNYQAIAAAQGQIASGVRVQRPSEDPNAAAQILQLRSALRATGQYQRNIDAGRSRLTAEEDVLDRLTEALTRAKVLGVGQGTGTANADTRLQTKAEVDNLLAFARELGNTRFQDEYLFGGYRSDVRPFALDTPPFHSGATPPAGDHQVEIAAGHRVPTTHNGTEILLDTEALQGLYELSTALGANDVDGIRAALGTLDRAIGKVQTRLGEVGARTNQLELMKTSLDSLALNLETNRSELEDTDAEKATVELLGRQVTLQAALLTANRMLSMSLADYLR